MPRTVLFSFTGDQLDTALSQWLQEQIDTGVPLQLAAVKRTDVAEFFASQAAGSALIVDVKESEA